MIALKTFTGVIDGKEIEFRKGDLIDVATVETLGLAGKPDLAKKVKTKEVSSGSKA